MINIVFVMPDPELVDLIEKVYRECEKTLFHAGNDGLEYSFRICRVMNKRQISQQIQDADIIIGRGAIIGDLSRLHAHIALVEVPIGCEMVSVLAAARKEHPGERVAVVGANNVTFAASGLGAALDMDIGIFQQEINEEYMLKRDLDRILAAGFTVLVCGPVTYRYARAQNLDCHPYCLRMSAESMRLAFEEARRQAVILHQQRFRSAQFQGVLNSAHEGIIATDADGRITVFNAHASEILHTPPDKLIGSLVYSLLPMTALTEDFRRLEQVGRIVSLYGEYFSINKTAIVLAGKLSGYVFTMQSSSSVRRVETEFRTKLYAKEHRANFFLDDIIGESPAIKTAKAKAGALAGSNANVLIVGANGTGKGLFAAAIHNAGARRNAPFAAVNCAMRPADCLERKLFGGAGGDEADTVGILEAAHTGTLFLDNVAELPPELQAKLGQTLRERTVTRPEDGRSVPIDIRVMAAADCRLEDDVEAGGFDRDLFFSLNVLTLSVPGLEQRGHDLLHLAAFFLDKLCRSYRKQAITLSDGACGMLMARHWPGQVRELYNVCERLVVLNHSGVAGEKEIARVLEESPR